MCMKGRRLTERRERVKHLFFHVHGGGYRPASISPSVSLFFSIFFFAKRNQKNKNKKNLPLEL